MIKRSFDIVVAFAGILLLFPPFLVIGILIKLDSPGPILFRQKRIGKGFQPFYIYKFRTMIENAGSQGGSITIADDPRVTRLGKCLRRFKVDEFPQLINVLKGEMSLVGPRPEVAEFVELFRQDYQEILKIRPGITDLASLKYRNEVEVLGKGSDAADAYLKRVLPDKIQLGKEYIKRASFCYDLKLISQTLLKLFQFESSR